MSKNKQIINNPLQLIEEGLKQSNWQKVSDAYFQLCGKRIKVASATESGQYDDLLGLLVTRYAKVNGISLRELYESDEIDNDENENLDREPTPIPVEDEDTKTTTKKRGRPKKKKSDDEDKDSEELLVDKSVIEDDDTGAVDTSLRTKELKSKDFNITMKAVTYDKVNTKLQKRNRSVAQEKESRPPIKSELKCIHCNKNFNKSVTILKTSMETGLRTYKCSFCKQLMDIK